MLGGLAGAGLVTGCGANGGLTGDRRQRATCVPRSALDPHRTLGDLALVYEVSQSRSRFFFDPSFFDQLQSWLGFYRSTAGNGDLDQAWTYGSWIDGGAGCDSWHHAGRAFDIARLRRSDRTFVSCRYDQWQRLSGSELEAARRGYWQLAASLHLCFASVLTYLYNQAHANHIHVDNGRSGNELSVFSTRSRVQVQAVQAICSYLFDAPVEITGRWDAATRQASSAVLDRVGLSGRLTSGSDSWHGFLRAAVLPAG